jgi:hypothetical protein
VAFLLGILAAILIVGGIVAAVRRELLWGAVLVVVGLVVGPVGIHFFG